jgi:phosphoserine phosphatase
MTAGSDGRHALVTDLDGTLVVHDTFVETLKRLAVRRPWVIAFVAVWALRGRAYCKAKVAATAPIDPACQAYEPAVLELIAQARDAGHLVALATASDRATADAIADHLGCFDAVLASDGRVNLKGRRKRKAIGEWCCFRRVTTYAYIGDSAADIPIWEAAAEVIVVRPSPRLEARVQTMHKPLRIIAATPPTNPAARDRSGHCKRIIEAIVEAVDGSLPGGDGAVRRDPARVVEYVSERVGGMQDHVRPLVAAAVRCFDLLTIGAAGGRFHRLPLSKRQAIWMSMRKSRIGSVATFAKLFDTLVLLGRAF